MEEFTGLNGTDCYRISHPSGAEATLTRHGGHLISWKTADGKERLYLSPDAEYSTGKAIRGGVPVIFPQFSDRGPFGRHGFARKSEWIADHEAGVLKLKSTEATRAEWPFDFELQLAVQLSDCSLEIEFAVHNSGSEPFAFQAAFHTYFQVDDATHATVAGLESRDFENEVTSETERGDENPIGFGEEVDRSYSGAGTLPVWLRCGDESLRIDTESFPDIVVWNPGPSHGIGDLPTDGWKQFICVESAQVRDGNVLAAGETWRGTQAIVVD